MMSSLLSKNIWLHWYKNLIWLSPKKQKNSNGCAIHLLLMLIHCRKAAKLFLNVKRNLLTFSATVYWGIPLRKKTLFKLGQKSRIKSIVGTHAVKALLPFVTTCLCECGFSVLAQIKTKTRNCLEPEDDTRLALNKISKFWQSCGNDTKSGLTLIKYV